MTKTLGTYISPMLLKLSLDSAVPVVFDVIIRSTGKLLGDDGPAVAMLLVACDKDSFFIIGPLALFQVWIEMIHKALSALLSLSTR